jgi:hypothetical protein
MLVCYALFLNFRESFIVRTDFFLHRNCWVHYCIFGNSERGYSAKADVSLLKKFPASYVPIRLERVYFRAEEAEAAIIDFCKEFIEESLIESPSGLDELQYA